MKSNTARQYCEKKDRENTAKKEQRKEERNLSDESARLKMARLGKSSRNIAEEEKSEGEEKNEIEEKQMPGKQRRTEVYYTQDLEICLRSLLGK